MIDFRSVILELERQTLDIERKPGGGFFHGNFNTTGTFSGSAVLEFSSPVERVETAIQSFHFEVKNDHNLQKLKIVPNTSFIDDTQRRIRVGVEASFKDRSQDAEPDDHPFIMTVTLLVLVEREASQMRSNAEAQ